MRNRTYERAASKGMEEQDLNLLKCPLRTVLTGFQEAKRVFESGTEEVRRLLLHECNIIYECCICRSMFRSLANFISHKRTFCCTVAYAGNSNGYMGQNSSFIIPSPEENICIRSRSITPSLISDARNNTVIERVKFEQTQQANVVDIDDNNGVKPQAELELERISDKEDKEEDSIKTEVDEALNKETALVLPDGKDITRNSIKEVDTMDTPEDNNDLSMLQSASQPLTICGIVCEICKMVFQTEKTLKIHIQKKHLPCTYVYQCPACSLTFLQPTGVIRHLTIEHKKPARTIRMMRETIVKRRVQLGEVKKPSREVKYLQMMDENSEKAEINSDKKDRKMLSTCSYCKRSFERRAALSTHLLNCQAKQKTLKNIAASKKNCKLQNVEPINTAIIDNKEVRYSANPAIKIKIRHNKEEKKEVTHNDDSLNALFDNLENQSFGTGLQTVTLDKLDMIGTVSADDESSNASYSTAQRKSVDIPQESSCTKSKPISAPENKPRRRFRIMHTEKRLSCRCKICNKQFNALSNLRRHISMFHYRARRFGCTLCEYRAFRRYDIVNHLGFVHKMNGEREIMATEYVSVHEVEYSKDDVDSDIVLITDEKELLGSGKEDHMKAYQKRRKRKKAMNAELFTINCKGSRQKLKCSLSQQTEKASIEVGSLKQFPSSLKQKRPIRNRIKPVNKDFVYDLSNLLKNENIASSEREYLRNTITRQNTVHTATVDDTFVDLKSNSGLDRKPVKSLITGMCKDYIIGTVRRLTLQLVNQGRAKSSTLPELPAERPQMRPRLISTCRGDMQAVPVIETSDLEAARRKSTLLDDTFLEKIAKRSSTVFQIKPCLALQHSALTTLLQKVDLSLHNNRLGGKANQTGTHVLTKDAADTNIVAKTTTFAEPVGSTETALDDVSAVKVHNAGAAAADRNHFIEPVPSIPKTRSPPPTPRKRITLMERLAENKASKHQNSLLRSALEH